MHGALPARIAVLWIAAMQGVVQAAAPPARTPTPAATSASGEQVYQRWCVHCHGSGRGMPGTQSLQVKYGTRLPAVLLERTDLTAPLITQFVRQGALSMPPFRKTEINDAELAALAAWMASGGGKR